MLPEIKVGILSGSLTKSERFKSTSYHMNTCYFLKGAICYQSVHWANKLSLLLIGFYVIGDFSKKKPHHLQME